MLNYLFIVVLVLAAPVLPDSQKTLDVVSEVDLTKYAGRWYEIARLPNRFQKDCAGEVTAVYSLIEDRRLQVVNACRQDDGQMERAEGVARLAEKNGSGAKLEVRFAPAWLSWLPVVWGDYWIIDLAPDYSYSVVGTPDRKYLWILARAPQMDDAVYDRLIRRVAERGFDVTRVVKTQQSRK